MSLSTYSQDIDSELDICDAEPIHVPSSIQPHGFALIVSTSTGQVIQCSENAVKYLSKDLSEIIGEPLVRIFARKQARELDLLLDATTASQSPASQHTLANFSAGPDENCLTVIAHKSQGAVVFEFEHSHSPQAVGAEESYPVISHFIQQVQDAESVSELSRLAAAEVRRLTGFDRVLVYRFDEDWNGLVIGEDGSGRLPSYLDHRFPAADIPKQARELYRMNRLRLIVDSGYLPVRLTPTLRPDTNQPLDMTHCVLRSVSPIHVEYMKNMETAASMSISIVRDGKLWGLVSCHHREPRQVPFFIRSACDLIGQVLALQLTATEHHSEFERSIELKALQSQLLERMIAEDDFHTGLVKSSDRLLRFARAEGVAIVADAECRLIGETPSESQVRHLVEWLDIEVKYEVYQTAELSSVYPPAAAFAAVGSGLMAISVSKLHPSYVLWFRPEVAQTLKWAGEPNKSWVEENGHTRLHPRKSFATWQEAVRGKSLPFQASEIEAAVELRNTIVGIVLRKAETLAELTVELERSNKELEAFSYSVSHDLRAPFRHIVGYAELLRERALPRLDSEEQRFLHAISESAEQAGTLVDNLLAFSRMGRQTLNKQRIDFHELVCEARDDAMKDAGARDIRWEIAILPQVDCDVMMMRLAVQNLLSNAVKYTRQRSTAIIQVECERQKNEYVFCVKDNGVGFDMRFASKLFGVFQRMHRMEDFEGTGIGLANVRRIVARHGGRTWAEAEIDRGARIYFTLPTSDE